MAAHMWIERTLVMTARRRQLGQQRMEPLWSPWSPPLATHRTSP